MNVEVKITFSVDEIIVQAGDSIKKYANLIGYDKPTNKIVAIGETEQEISAYNPELWQKRRQDVIFCPIFDPVAFDIERVALFIWFIDQNIYPGFRLFTIFDWNSYSLRIPFYEAMPTITRQKFEFSLQNQMKLADLIVNGNPSAYKGWKLYFAKGSFKFASKVSMLISFALLYITTSAWVPLLNWWDEEVIGIGTLILILSFFSLVTLFSIWIAEFFWILIAKTFIPKHLVRWICVGIEKKKNKRGLTSYHLVNLVLGKEEDV